MDVEWNEARMDEGVTDGHSHNSFRSDTHEEIREVEIEYFGGTMETMELLQIPAIQGSTKDTGMSCCRQRLIDPVMYDMVLRKYQRICSQHVV